MCLEDEFSSAGGPDVGPGRYLQSMRSYATVTGAELAPMLRRDSEIARRWHSRLQWVPGLNVKWSILMLEVWCHEMADSIDEDSDDVDVWLKQIHESFIDLWHQHVIDSCLVTFSKPALALALGAVLGWVVAAVAGVSMLSLVGGGLVSISLLGRTWSCRRYVCGPHAHDLCTDN